MSYNGSGYLSVQLTVAIYCEICEHEWEENVTFDDMAYAYHETECPSCKEYVLYKEDLHG